MNEKIGTGICFYFEHDSLEAELKKQIDKNTQEAGKIETELPDLKEKVVALEKGGRMRSEEHQEAEQRVEVFEHVLANLRGKNSFLAFYAAHLSPGTTVLTMSDAHELGFIGYEHGIGMISDGRAERALVRKRGY